jgi:eukaryotic-like serine/threonine-protein kinase
VAVPPTPLSRDSVGASAPSALRRCPGKDSSPDPPCSFCALAQTVCLLDGATIGRGVSGTRQRLDRLVAIKVLPPAFVADPDRLRRFEQEARAVATLDHPHICQIYDVGPGYLVLEYVEGSPPCGPMAAEEAVRLGLQIAGALEAPHRLGILHRDLKPANILVTADGIAKLLDFGLANTLLPSDQDLTRTVAGTVAGTFAYMSPEQAQGKPVDARSDVFSFGAVWRSQNGHSVNREAATKPP